MKLILYQNDVQESCVVNPEHNGRFSFKMIHRLTLGQGHGVNRESSVNLKCSMKAR